MEKAQLEEEFYQWMKENIREMKGIEQISIFKNYLPQEPKCYSIRIPYRQSSADIII